jgi:hypothetical protein
MTDPIVDPTGGSQCAPPIFEYEFEYRVAEYDRERTAKRSPLLDTMPGR